MLKSDSDTLDEYYQDSIRKIRNILNPRQKNRIRSLIICFCCVVISLLLLTLNSKFIILTYVSILVFVALVIIDLSKRIRIYLTIKKYNADFKKFKEKYKGFDQVVYRLLDDILQYDGDEFHECKWTDFTSIAVFDDFFILDHPHDELRITIPKMVLVNKEDYELFKTFAAEHIKNNLIS